EFRPRGGERFILLLVGLEKLGVVENFIEARRPLQGCDLTEELLTGTRGRDALDDDLLAGGRERPDLQGGRNDGDQQRQGEKRQPEEHQAAQGLGANPLHQSNSTPKALSATAFPRRGRYVRWCPDHRAAASTRVAGGRDPRAPPGRVDHPRAAALPGPGGGCLPRARRFAAPRERCS